MDDGSSDNTSVEAEKGGAVILRHDANQGKGVALETGFDYARNNGFDVVITMDGDGQHSPKDIPGFVDMYRKTRHPILVGNRMSDAKHMPMIRRLTNSPLATGSGSWLNWGPPAAPSCMSRCTLQEALAPAHRSLSVRRESFWICWQRMSLCKRK